MSYRVSPILKSAHFCAETGKNVLKYCYHAYKNIDMLYLSNGARLAYGYNYSKIGTHI